MANEPAQRMDDLSNSLIIAAVAVLCSLILYHAGDPFKPLVLLPGLIIGMYASVIVSGNPHGGSLAVVVVVAAFVNYFVYAILAYSGFRIYGRLHGGRQAPI
jgi:hypothetical protein